MDNRTYGLIGYPVSHSFSQKFFTEKFHKLGLPNYSYEVFPMKDIADFPNLIEQYNTLCGLNVTIPHKQSVMPFLTDLHETAKNVGAVNCIKINRSNAQITLTGYNTDVIGFKQTLKPLLKSHQHRALILGTGGAAKAVEYVLKEIGIEVWYASREKKQEQKNTLTYTEINQHALNAFLLVVNCTPLGMLPHIAQFPKIPYEYITDKHLCIDLIYNPAETQFLKKAKEHGATVENGLSMLYAQAEAAWQIWRE